MPQLFDVAATPENFRFAVAFSFAGPHRDKVRAIAERVSVALDPECQQDRSRGRVFFDEWFEHEILGSDMDVLLQRIYHDQSLMVVADLSEDYAGREWTQAEARAIRALRKKLDTARDETARLRLLNIRLGEGDVPGILGTEGWLDGRKKSVEECAQLILKRLELLQRRRGDEGDGRGREGGTGTGHEKPQAGAKPVRNWVWHATLASRAAGQVSVWACVETLLAVALYWWIAVRFDTHWHLVSSVFVAPLLLLRSPASMEAGVRWFLGDWFGLEKSKLLSARRTALWIGGLALVSGFPAWCVARALSIRWLPGAEGWALFCGSATIGVLASLTAGAFAAIAFAAIAGQGAITRALAGAVMGAVMGALAGALAGAFAGAGLDALAGGSVVALAGFVALAIGRGDTCLLAVSGFGFGLGFALRSLVIRIAATLRHLLSGLRSLPANWRENNFLTDAFVPAELLPGIREHQPAYALDGLLRRLRAEGPLIVRFLVFPLLGVVWFLPALLYRLNIKATAWFWWPLAYLLRPAPALDAQAQRKQALCWPWTNPFQMLWIIVSVVLAVVSLTVHNLDLASWAALNHIKALPVALKVLLAMDWAHFAPWHWAQWTIAVCGAGMLALAGNARSHDVNGNWLAFQERWPWTIRLMIGLQRLRTLATIALLLMALGALLLQDRTWQTHVPVPDGWIKGLERLYQIQR